MMHDSCDLTDLADWLESQRHTHESSVARNDQVVKTYIERLRRWEKMLRENQRH